MSADVPSLAADAPVDVSGLLATPTAPCVPRSRARLAIVALGALVWMLPWLGPERGPARSGAPAALALLACWGLAATALLARTRRGLLVGEAATAAALAGLLTALVATHHPWLPGPDRRATWVPIFGPLALLALLDLVSHRFPRGLGREIAVIRSGAALVAAGALLVALQPLPALVALWLAVAPAGLAFARTARGARRVLEALSLLAAAAWFAAPDLHRALLGAAVSSEVATVWAFLHRLLAIALGVLAVRGLVVPDADDDRDAGDGDDAPAPSPARGA